MFLKAVRRTMDRYGMVRPGDRVLVAVSGGVDSIVLLHALFALREVWGLTLHVGHLNHGLRGADADRDAAFVRATAERLGLPVTVGEAGGTLRAGFGSLEDRARQERYAFLGRLAEAWGAHRIALGHTRNDVAETLLINLLRGTGVRGLAGIPPVRDGRIIRPLIGVTRQAVEAYAATQGLTFVTDASNADPAFLRNRIRHELLPLLAKGYAPQATEALARLADIVREEDALLDRLAREALASAMVRAGPDGAALEAGVLGGLPRALFRRVLRLAAERAGSLRRLSFRQVEALEGLLGPGGREVTLPGRMVAFRDADLLRIVPAGNRREVFGPVTPLAVGKEVAVPSLDFRFRLTWVSPGTTRQPGPFRALLDLRGLPGDLAVRPWRPGDRFRPSGLRGTKKLQDFFVDAKIPRAERSRIPLLLAGDRIIWVVGWRVAEEARPRPGADWLLWVEAEAGGSP